MIGKLAGRASNSEVDLALLLVESGELQSLGPIESFDDVKVGEEVVAVGNPLGLDFTVTKGIISGKRASVYLQTDTPINHGNTGAAPANCS